MKLIRKQLRSFVGRSLTFHLTTSFVVHLVLIAYGEIQDRLLEVKYTDIDYVIFTDGARHMAAGGSPFDRATYRYTPWLAWLMQPNLWAGAGCFGKLVFSALDIICGWLIYQSLPTNIARRAYTLIWLYNPLTLIISTRGSSESIITTLVFLVIFFLNRRQHLLAGLFFGFVVHFKIYPVIYALPFYLGKCVLLLPMVSIVTNSFLFNSLAVLDTVDRKRRNLFTALCPNMARVRFGVASVVGLVVPTYVAYHWYGQLYLDEAWLYHFHRQDLQHNFSPYFYIYQSIDDESYRSLVSRLAFGPQLLAIIVAAFYYNFANRHEVGLYMSLFTQTFLFVTLNKVITAQYFEWYICFIPLIAPFVDISPKNWVAIFAVWSASIIQWLLPAYLYEFRKWNVLPWLGGASFAFVAINLTLLGYICARFISQKQMIKAKANKNKKQS